VNTRNEAELERPEKQKDFIAVVRISRTVCLWFRKYDQCMCPFFPKSLHPEVPDGRKNDECWWWREEMTNLSAGGIS